MRLTLFVIVAISCQSAVAANGCDVLHKIAQSYKIEIVTADQQFPVRLSRGLIEGKNPDLAKLEKYVLLFAHEFTLYPRSLIKRSQLKQVVLCEELSYAGQRRNAIPDFEHHALYLDVSRGAYNKSYLRKVIHHEFFHIIDRRDDGNLYKDASWNPLNPPNFKYGDGGRNAQDLTTTSHLTSKFPGFLNHYSTTGVEEDKAEIFANLMVDPAHVATRASEDGVLNAKVKRMKDLLATFCPDINEAFWEKVRNTKRSAK